jgi:hypothetical protein
MKTVLCDRQPLETGFMQEELKKMLKAAPFVPFTIVMRDGTHITVKHPENALLMKHWIYVATDGGETAEHLYLLHVTSIQRQQTEAA